MTINSLGVAGLAFALSTVAAAAVVHAPAGGDAGLADGASRSAGATTAASVEASHLTSIPVRASAPPLRQGRLSTRVGALEDTVERLERLGYAHAEQLDKLLSSSTAASSGAVVESGEAAPSTARQQARTSTRDGSVALDWAGRMRTIIDRNLETQASRATEVFGVECRRTRCELSLRHDSDAAATTFRKQLVVALERLLPGVDLAHADLGGGRVRTVVRLTGERLGWKTISCS